jgi:hypothetical protein
MGIVQSDVQSLSSTVAPAQAELLNAAITNADFKVAKMFLSALLYLADINVSNKIFAQRIL